MRIVAVLALVTLTACQPSDCPVGRPGRTYVPAPEFLLVWTDFSGALIASESGATIQLPSTSARCWSTRTLGIRNVGRASGTFVLSPPSAQFQYDAGPYVLGPAEQVTFDLRIDASGEPLAVLTHELRLEKDLDECSPGSTATFTLSSQVVVSSLDGPVIDFGAVVLGDSKRLEMANVSGLSGDYSADDGGVRFAPMREGTQSIRADWTSDSQCLPIAARLIGDGVADPFGASPASIDFGATPIGTQVERDVEFEVWTTDQPVPRLSALTSSDYSFVERWSESTAPLRGDAGLSPARHVLTLRFQPTQAGAQSGALEFAIGNRLRTIPFRGVGGP
jgi:hypothetical protein